MKHNRLSALLAAGMMLTAFPATPQNTPLLLRPVLIANAATSGTCGENVNWEYDAETGKLTITGTGGMDDGQPWKNYKKEIVSVVIEDGVTSIGTDAFERCQSLSSVRIPDSVTKIGENVFGMCNSLKQIQLPDSLTEIGASAFSGCINLTSAAVPDGVTAIGDYTFHGCEKLTAVSLPANLTSIGKEAFSECRVLAEIHLPESLTGIGVSAFQNCKALTEIVIPASVPEVSECAFNGCSSLTSATVSNGVAVIEFNAFSSCTSLTSVTLPSSVTTIGAQAFASCRALTKITLPEGLTKISKGAFSCSGLTSVTVPATVTSIENGAFFCTSLTDITILNPDCEIRDDSDTDSRFVESSTISNSSDRDEADNYLFSGTIHGFAGSTAEAYANKYSRRFEEIPAGQTGGTCGENLTWKLDSSGTLTISGTGAMDDYNMYSMPFADLTFTKAVISDGVTSIGEFAFYKSEGLTEVTIADSVTSIGYSAFSGCSALTEAAIPESVTSIGNSAFSHTPWLDAKKQENPFVVVNGMLMDGTACSGDVVIPDGVTGILGDAFAFNTRMTGLTIPDSVTSIGSSAFYECVNLAEISIPASVERIGSKAFGKTPWLKAQQEKAPLVVVNGILVDGTTCSGEAVLSDGVTRINDAAFSYCSGLTNITIPDSLTSIGAWAFNYCTGLTSITIPAGVTSIGAEAFHECRNLTIRGYAGSAAETYATENKIPFEAIGGETGGQSGQCGENLTWELKDGVLTISGTGNMTNYTVNDMPFSGLSFSKLVITDGVTSIGNNAFASCSVLKELSIPESVTLIGSEAFGGCTALTDITILNSACQLFDDVNTINSTAAIHGFAGSTAEEYANKYDRRFKVITSPEAVSGDYNGDGEVTVADAVLLIRFFAEGGSLTQKEIDSVLSGNPDINGDGLVTLLDMTELLNQLKPDQ